MNDPLPKTDKNAVGNPTHSPASPYFGDKTASPSTPNISPKHNGVLGTTESSVPSPISRPKANFDEDDHLLNSGNPIHEAQPISHHDIQIIPVSPPEATSANIESTAVDARPERPVQPDQAQIQRPESREINTGTQRPRPPAPLTIIDENMELAQKMATNKLKFFCFGLAINTILSILGALAESGKIPYQSFLFLIIGILGIVLLYNSMMGLSPSATRKDKICKCLHMAILISFLIYFITATLKTYQMDCALYVATIPGWAITLVFSGLIFRSYLPESVLNNRIGIVQIVLWVQITAISAKIEGTEIPWSLAFLPILAFELIMLTTTLMLLLVLISTLIARANYSSRSGRITLIGRAWYFSISLITCLWAALILLIEKKLEALEEDTGTVPIQQLFEVGTLYSAAILFITILLRKTLIRLISTEILSVLQRVVITIEPQYEVKFESSRPAVAYLARISGTYFSLALNSLYKRDKLKLQQWSEQIVKAKQDKYHSPLLHAHTEKTLDLSPGKRSRAFSFNELTLIKAHSEETCVKHSEDNAGEEKQVNISIENHEHKKCVVGYSCDDVDVYHNVKRPLEDARAEIQEKDKCFVCYENEPNAVIMECGHGGICYDCAIKAWEKNDKCHMCRKEVSSVLKVHNFYELDISKVTSATIKVKAMIE